jgi:hypothetical protein
MSLDTPSRVVHFFKFLSILVQNFGNFVHIAQQSFMFLDTPSRVLRFFKFLFVLDGFMDIAQQSHVYLIHHCNYVFLFLCGALVAL